jgi:uncharacterized membrane protein
VEPRVDTRAGRLLEAIVFSLLGLAAIIVAVIALRRAQAVGPLQRRVEELELDLATLRDDLDRSRSRAQPSQPAAPPEPSSPFETPAATPTATTPSPEAPPSRAAEGIAASPGTPSPPPAAPAPAARASRRRGFQPPSFQLPDIEWERWIGVRGAAVLGGIVLAMAGVYFFQYSIAHGLIPPWLRVVIGTSLGLACIAGAELRLRSRYEAAANALIGGGIVLLYSAFWASRSLYGLVDTPVAFVLMISVTAACTALANRHASLVIAMIGLIGGFATPALLSTGSDRPIALFAYILLLDACLLFVARRRGWPILAMLSLVGTLAYQAAWILDRMASDQLMIAIGVLAVFGIAYGFALRDLPAEGRRQWLVTQASAALFPFFFALFLASQGELEEHIFPVVGLVALLSASASWIGRTQGLPWLGLGAAAASTAVFAVEIFGRSFDTAMAWEASGLAVLLAAVFHVFVELDREPAGRSGPAPAAMLATGGLFILLAARSITASDVAVWPWLAGWMGLAALALRHGGCPGRGALQPAAAAGLALALLVFRLARGGNPVALPYATEAGVTLCLAVLLQIVALMRVAPDAQRWGQRAASLFPLIALLSLPYAFDFHDAGALLGLASLSLLGFLSLIASTRMPSGRWMLATVLVTAYGHFTWTRTHPALIDSESVGMALVAQALTVLLFAYWPFVAFSWLRGDRFAWYAAALAGPAWFVSLRALYSVQLGDETIGLLPIGLGAVALGSAVLASRMRAIDDPIRKSNLAWFLAVALGFGTVAIPLQLEKEWITLGWALEGLATVWLWRRLDHPGLKYFALALFVSVTLRLVANEAVLGYYPRPGLRIVNWLFYTYLIPAAAMLASVRLLLPVELERVRSFERPLYRFGQPIVAGIAGLGAIAIVFVWINLAIADWFAVGPSLQVSFDRMPARDLTTSIAWALYALTLLAAGVRAQNRGLRWLSLGLILTATLKVFLHDLGELEDLYRVASLLGLAVSLIAISLAYQRFVVPLEAKEQA